MQYDVTDKVQSASNIKRVDWFYSIFSDVISTVNWVKYCGSMLIIPVFCYQVAHIEFHSDISFSGVFFISSFRLVQNVVCFLLGDSPASDLYMPTFRNTLSVPFSKAPAFEDGTYRVFRNVGIYKSDAGESPKRKQTTFLGVYFPFTSVPFRT